MSSFDTIGADWLAGKIEAMDDTVERHGPVPWNEEHRYLPSGVTPRAGYIRYDLFPFLREVIECFDPASQVREVNFKKGVQTGYTTLLESIMLYYIGHIRTAPVMFITADKELAAGRVENNILPMINESGFSDHIRSADEGNNRKTGKTKDFIQWRGGGFMIYNGALNAAKMRQYSVPCMLKDELDGWRREVGKDGNSDTLTDARLSAYWNSRKILRGSTPLLVPSMIDDAYKRGDRRKYNVCCRSCGFPQELRFKATNKKTGVVGGFSWELENDSLILDSVRWNCIECGHAHAETDKERLFAAEHGAAWVPTADPVERGIRSYHLPSFYSPFGFRPWSKCVGDYLAAYDHKTQQVKDISKLQEFYNNTLGEPFEVRGQRIRANEVSKHRRAAYAMGEIPNTHALEYCGSEILFLTCSVDIHKKELPVAVFGWTRDARCYLIYYTRIETPEPDKVDCTSLDSPAWGVLRDLIEDKVYSDRYRIALTFIDASYANDTATKFASEYDGGVFPILGRDRPGKSNRIQEFAEFTTQNGTQGYRLTVDHYKDRLATVLRREWHEENGAQPAHHFNAPADVTKEQLKELTTEVRREEIDSKGNITYPWYRPGNVPNELWDCLVYGHAAVEVLAHSVCIEHFELDTVDWVGFWEFAALPENDEMFGRVAPPA